ncbi:hypothetical protein [Labrys monachus]|uniref:Mll5186 protein n=1 Tax=Labrys monachus TaxID=217067 RepID=A0ABU0FA41_9HYPH|nr:hypothetical protein [Labrys monachus]MDQ0391460.1 hypothetical protein [Labrys monachus]
MSLSSIEITSPDTTSDSAVSWAAIIAGAVGAAALSLILLLLGSGLGLSMASPWSGPSVTTFAVSTAIWLIVVQWLASGVGGYIAGRLRTKWSGIHTDEVTFRDTAHGFLAWALATLLVAGLLGSAVTSIVGGGASAVTSIASGAAQGAANKGVDSLSNSSGYYVDMLLRPAQPAAGSPAPAANAADARTELSHIFVMSLANGSLSASDKDEVVRLVASQTGMSQADAQKRVDDVVAQIDSAKEKMKQAADEARKAGSKLALMTFLSLLIGAFIASAAAALGGKQRDEY